MEYKREEFFCYYIIVFFIKKRLMETCWLSSFYIVYYTNFYYSYVQIKSTASHYNKVMFVNVSTKLNKVNINLVTNLYCIYSSSIDTVLMSNIILSPYGIDDDYFNL